MHISNGTTPISIEYEDNDYIPTQGAVKKWIRLKKVLFGKESEVFSCNWKNAFGRDLLQAGQLNICELATIRIEYNPLLFKYLDTGNVKIINHITQKSYMVYGSPDNYLNLNMIIEFKVQAMEGK